MRGRKEEGGNCTCNASNMPELHSYVASIDQGTSSSRCIVFDQNGSIVSEFQMEHEQFYPEPGFVEHDAEEIWVRYDVSLCWKQNAAVCCCTSSKCFKSRTSSKPHA